MISKTIDIQAPVAQVWQALTDPVLVKQWMAEPETEMELLTKWETGGPIIIKGFHHVPFVNKGTVLQFEPNKVLAYNHLSSLSRLPDEPENYSVFVFELSSLERQTTLNLTVINFPTETIFKHLDFYWTSTLTILKNMIEQP